jgi:TolB protein
MTNRTILFTLLLLVLPVGRQLTLAQQDWFRTGTGLGAERVKLAVPDFPTRSPELATLAQVFNQTLKADLEYAGIFEVRSPSFYPLKQPATPAEVTATDWNQPPVDAHVLVLGNLSTEGTQLILEGWALDVRDPRLPQVVGQRYRDEPTAEAARRIAHQLADQIVIRLGGGVPGIHSTKIVFISNRSGAKEVWVCDYDGANAKQLTRLRSISLSPKWSPEGRRIAFSVKVGNSWEVQIFSLDTGKLLAFPRFRGLNTTPAWSPDGNEIIFCSSMAGDPELYLVDWNGRNLKRLTYVRGVEISPALNPKTGAQIAFVSDRGGSPQIYLMDRDGANVQLLAGGEGYVVDPAWSPNGQLLAFSWRRPNGNYDIYVMDVATRDARQLTRDVGRNEHPSWAPDGRHIVFQSNRTGSWQLWTMLADGSQPRQITQGSSNEAPNWGPP